MKGKYLSKKNHLPSGSLTFLEGLWLRREVERADILRNEFEKTGHFFPSSWVVPCHLEEKGSS